MSSDGVPLLRWPAAQAQAEALEEGGLPFLLLVGEAEPPPLSGYRFMDWVRSPVDAEELLARRSNLERRFNLARDGARPSVDDTGRLWFGSASVDLAPSQLPVVSALLAAYREVVPIHDMRTLLGLEPADSNDIFSGRLLRLRRRLRCIGLEVTRVGHCGYALEPAPDRYLSDARACDVMSTATDVRHA